MLCQQNIKHDYVRLRPQIGWGLRSTLGCCLTLAGSQALGCPWRQTNTFSRNISKTVKPSRKHKYLHTAFQNVIAIGRSVVRPRTHRAQRLPVLVHTCMYTRLNFTLFLPCITTSSSRHQGNKMHKIFSEIFILSHWIYLHAAIRKGNRQGINPE